MVNTEIQRQCGVSDEAIQRQHGVSLGRASTRCSPRCTEMPYSTTGYDADWHPASCHICRRLYRVGGLSVGPALRPASTTENDAHLGVIGLAATAQPRAFVYSVHEVLHTITLFRRCIEKATQKIANETENDRWESVSSH